MVWLGERLQGCHVLLMPKIPFLVIHTYLHPCLEAKTEKEEAGNLLLNFAWGCPMTRVIERLLHLGMSCNLPVNADKIWYRALRFWHRAKKIKEAFSDWFSGNKLIEMSCFWPNSGKVMALNIWSIGSLSVFCMLYYSCSCKTHEIKLHAGTPLFLVVFIGANLLLSWSHSFTEILLSQVVIRKLLSLLADHLIFHLLIHFPIFSLFSCQPVHTDILHSNPHTLLASKSGCRWCLQASSADLFLPPWIQTFSLTPGLADPPNWPLQALFTPVLHLYLMAHLGEKCRGTTRRHPWTQSESLI